MRYTPGDLKRAEGRVSEARQRLSKQRALIGGFQFDDAGLGTAAAQLNETLKTLQLAEAGRKRMARALKRSAAKHDR